MNPTRFVAVTILIFCSALLGCSRRIPGEIPVFPVNGTILDGEKPLANAMVILHPASDTSKQLPARAMTDENGNFQVTTFRQGDGAALGKYKVTVELYEPIKVEGNLVPGPNVLSKTFSNPTTSQFEVEVVEPVTELAPIRVHR
jgi:hypothetical protein